MRWSIAGNVMLVAGRVKCGYELSAYAGNPLCYLPKKADQSWHMNLGSGEGLWTIKVDGKTVALTNNSVKQIWPIGTYIDLSLVLSIA